MQKGTPFCLVSSDVQPAPGTAEFLICPRCLAVQKTITPAWQAMANQIYAQYDINHQSHGAEPTVFDSAKGSGPRSLMLLRNLLDMVELAEKGRLLDIGCSNGNLLKSFHGLRPGWKLSGAELLEQWKDTVLSLPGVEAFYSGPSPAAYAGLFDVISLSHVLEHIPGPVAFLKAISSQLTTHGRLLLATPNLRQNPSDLIIADHCSHFEEDSLAYVAKAAGLRVDCLSTKMLPELAVYSRHRPPDAPRPAPAAVGRVQQRCLYYFGLLEKRVGQQRPAEGRPFTAGRQCRLLDDARCSAQGGLSWMKTRADRSRASGLPIFGPAQRPSGVVFIPMSVAGRRSLIAGGSAGRFRYVATNRQFSGSTFYELSNFVAAGMTSFWSELGAVRGLFAARGIGSTPANKAAAAGRRSADVAGACHRGGLDHRFRSARRLHCRGRCEA